MRTENGHLLKRPIILIAQVIEMNDYDNTHLYVYDRVKKGALEYHTRHIGLLTESNHTKVQTPSHK